MTAPRMVFVGSKSPGLAILKAIAPSVSAVVTFDDRKDARSVYPEILEFCAGRGLPVHDTRKAESERDILALRPDLCVVCGWYWLFRGEFLRQVPLGVVGVHHSLLPRYRGGSPLVWSIIEGEPKVGTSFFYFSEGMDDGDLIDQRSLDLTDDDSIGTLLPHLEELDVDMVAAQVQRLLSGTAPRTPQDHSKATRCVSRKPEDGRILWDWSSRRIFNFVRAQSLPYPGAWTESTLGRVSIERTELVDSTGEGAPGKILDQMPTGPLVACGEGALRIREVRVEGVVLPSVPLLQGADFRVF